MSHDVQRGETFLFGGRAPEFLGDSWALRGDAWVQLSPQTSPPPRAFHGAAYDSQTNEIVLFGGRNGPQLYDDTWMWNGEEWRQHSDWPGPSARGIYALVDDRRRGQLVFHGGGSMPAERWLLHDETWILDEGRWSLRWPR
jgi:hypothetical protein